MIANRIRNNKHSLARPGRDLDRVPASLRHWTILPVARRIQWMVWGGRVRPLTLLVSGHDVWYANMMRSTGRNLCEGDGHNHLYTYIQESPLSSFSFLLFFIVIRYLTRLSGTGDLLSFFPLRAFSLSNCPFCFLSFFLFPGHCVFNTTWWVGILCSRPSDTVTDALNRHDRAGQWQRSSGMLTDGQVSSRSSR